MLSANPDGSLKLTQSRAETASDLTAAIIRLSLSLILGFMGILAMIQGTEKAGRAAQARERHVGSNETRAHEILAEVGPNAGFLLIRCSNQQMVDEVTAKVNEYAIFQWTGTREKFLESLGPGSQYDWVRTAIGESLR